MAHDVFISYRSEDHAAAERLCNGLESRQVKCWIAPRDIPAATEWPTAIVNAIAACRFFVLVLSSNSKNAKQISREAELADQQGSAIITFRIEDVQPPPALTYFLGNIQWLDAFGEKFEDAVACVAELVKKPDTAPPTHVAPPSPPRSRPLLDPTPIPDPPAAGIGARSKTTPPWIGIAAAAAVVLIAAIIWFATRPTPPPTPTLPPNDEMNAAKSVADRFLEERAAGNYDAAWAEYTPAFRERINKTEWLGTQEKLSQHGRVSNKFNGCTATSNGYFCDYTLSYPDGTSENNKLWLVKNGSGGWAISTGSIKQLHKS